MWVDIWNGDLSLIDIAVHEDFTSHTAPLAGGPAADSTGRLGLSGWISASHAMVQDLAFTVQIGPLVDEPHITLRWYATGTHEGRPVGFHGIDILRVADGMIAEYWLSADSIWFAQQLGVRELPPVS
nr:ester cyclase [Kibdelosporangium phytohabitans]